MKWHEIADLHSQMALEAQKLIDLTVSVRDTAARPSLCLATFIHVRDLAGQMSRDRVYAQRDYSGSTESKERLDKVVWNAAGTVRRAQKRLERWLAHEGMLEFILAAVQEIDNATSND